MANHSRRHRQTRIQWWTNQTSIVATMFYNQLLRSRRMLFIIAAISAVLAVQQFYPQRSGKASTRSPSLSRSFSEKLVEINDRQPSFRLYVYEGYETNAPRFRAQAKLLDDVKLHDRCQQNPRLIVVDIGASVGQFGLYAAACGCQVYMFEVDPLKISLLQKSIELNSFQSRVRLFTKAVSDLPSNSEIFIGMNSSSQRSSRDNGSNVYSVSTINLNTMNITSEIYLFRVDVEGYELHVFRSSESLFRRNLIHHVLFQYTPAGTDRIVQNDLLSYIRDILGGRRFYALHPKEALLFGPLYNEDIDQFYTQHHAIELERDVYVLFQDEDLNIQAKTYDFSSSFN